MAAITLQTIPSFYTKIAEKSLFISAKNRKIHCLNRLLHRASRRQEVIFTASENHIILLGNVEELLRSWIHFVSPINTWTVCIHYSSIE